MTTNFTGTRDGRRAVSRLVGNDYFILLALAVICLGISILAGIMYTYASFLAKSQQTMRSLFYWQSFIELTAPPACASN
jgi:hypothetical protein